MVTGINPSMIRVFVEKKVRKMLRVKVRTTGRLAGRLQSRKLKVDPPAVEAEGPEHIISQLDSVETEEVNLAALQSGMVLEKRLRAPAPDVKLLRDEPVNIRLARPGL
jgi:YbbR domain-containing protein